MAIKSLDKKIESSRRKAYSNNKQRYNALKRKKDETVTQFRKRAKKYLYK